MHNGAEKRPTFIHRGLQNEATFSTQPSKSVEIRDVRKFPQAKKNPFSSHLGRPQSSLKMSAADQLLRQWQNPGDILSLLLLIGGNTVQQAIAQLFGVYVQPSKRLPRIYVTPVAFSFGWVAYALTSLASAIGDKQLMPPTPDCPAMMVNCSTGYVRTNRSWLLGRTLRDHELFLEAQPGEEVAKLSDEQLLRDAGLGDHGPLKISLRINIFTEWTWRYAPPDRPCLEIGLDNHRSSVRNVNHSVVSIWQLGDLRDHRCRHSLYPSHG